jgi:hypothetical protein
MSIAPVDPRYPDLRYYFPPERVEERALEADLCVYGGNAAGVVAAVQAARLGLRAMVLEPSRHLGGMTAGGLGQTDIGNKEAIGGISREFYARCGAKYGVEIEWRFEPHVAEQVLHEMAEEAGVTWFTGQFLEDATRGADGRLLNIRTESGLTVHAGMFIDATYEGDLLARAGVTYFVGREGNEVYGETMDGQHVRNKHQFDYFVDPYVTEGDAASGLLPGFDPDHSYTLGAGDRRVQAYNFRMCLTQREDIRVPFPQPVGYDSAWYELQARYLRGGWNQAFQKFDKVRNGKTDTNNHGAVSTDFIGQNFGWPEGTFAEREAIFQRHVIYQQGFQWFMANDPRVPAAIREPMATWGLCRDEFMDCGGWPHQLYVREARRMVSDYVLTEADCRWQRTAEQSVGLAAYGMDSHNCRRIVIDGAARNEGDVQTHVTGPYAIDYRAIVPRRGECGNLLVPVCLSASHIAYGSARMEPVFMVLGQSAATAAFIALREQYNVQDVPYDALQPELLKGGQRLAWEGGAPAEHDYNIGGEFEK